MAITKELTLFYFTILLPETGTTPTDKGLFLLCQLRFGLLYDLPTAIVTAFRTCAVRKDRRSAFFALLCLGRSHLELTTGPVTTFVGMSLLGQCHNGTIKRLIREFHPFRSKRTIVPRF